MMHRFDYYEHAVRQGDAVGMASPPDGLPMPYFVDPHTGDKRFLSLFPTPADHPMMAFKSREANIPESSWTEYDVKTIVPIRDQDGRGACVAFAWIKALMQAYAKMGLVDIPPLSEWFLYSEINGGRDAGASIGDGGQALLTVGAPPDSAVPYATIRPKGYSKAAQTAAIYKLAKVESLGAGNRDGILSALQRRNVVVVLDVRAGAWFNADSQGTAAFGRGMTNHAVPLTGPMRKLSGKWQGKIDNSWAETWGAKGSAWLTDSHLEASTDAWVAEAADIPDGAIMPPTVPSS